MAGELMLLCAPAAAVFCGVPFLFEVQSLSRASAAAMFMWLSTFKLVRDGRGWRGGGRGANRGSVLEG